MSAVISLLVTLWGLVGSQLIVSQLDGPVQFTDLYGSERTAEAALACPPGGPPQLLLSPQWSMETLLHELSHAYDCQDDGVMDGSPTTRPAERPAWASDYCWTSDAEWYACSVVHYGSVHPDEVAPWGAATTAAEGAAARDGRTVRALTPQ